MATPNNPVPTPIGDPALPGSTPAAGQIRCPHCHNPIALVGERPDEVVCPGCGSSFQVRETRHTTTVDTLKPLGKFQMLERVGVGGFGAVWKVRDTELDRIVALKVPHAGQLASANDLERFQREARAAAQLRHPGIVTVHEVRTLDGTPTIVSDFVDGVPLKDLMESRRLTFRETAKLVAEVAEALDYAHSMGLVHRDVKPANIMLEAGVRGQGAGGRGQEAGGRNQETGGSFLTPDSCPLTPRLMDFGLALRDQVEVTMTLDGHIIGTPAYMSPEQAAGKSHQADRRSDVYSLGVVLYEMLCGELPFRGSRLMMLHHVLREEPRPPRRLNDKIPRDLETICLKALAKAPGRRYQTAREFADDLRRYLAGEPVLARPVGRLERGWRWCRRNPALATAAGLAAAALLIGTVVSTVFAVQAYGAAQRESHVSDNLREEQKRTKIALRDAEEERDRADTLLAEQYLDQGLAACWKEHNGGLGMLWMCQALEAAPAKAKELRRTIRTNLAGWGQEGNCLRAIVSHEGPVMHVAFSPDGNTVLTGSKDKTARLWSGATGKLLGRPLQHQDEVTAMAFSPDGKTVVTCSTNTARLWSVASSKPLGPPLQHQDRVSAVAFSPDSKIVRTGSHDKTARLWSVATGQALRQPWQHQGAVDAVAFSPDGKTILTTSSGDFIARLWSVDTGKLVGQPMQNQGMVVAVAFSPDGKTVLTGDFYRKAQLWSAATGRPLGPAMNTRA